MKTVKAGCTAAALLAAMFAVPAMAQSASAGASASGGVSAGTGGAATGATGGVSATTGGAAANAGATGGVTSGTGGTVGTSTGSSVGSSTTAAPSTASTPNANDPSAAPGIRSAANVDSNLNTTMPVATIPGGAVVQYTPSTATMGASGTSMAVAGPSTVTYTHYFVNVPADAMSRAEFRRWMALK